MNLARNILCLWLLAAGGTHASGQPMTVNDPILPFDLLSSAGPIVADQTDVEYRWVASDLASNATISGNWTDRVQSLSYLEGAATRRPTNTAGGIWLDSSHWLTNAMTTMGSNVSFGFILKIIDVTDPNGGFVYPGFGGNNFSGADGSGRLDFRWNYLAGTYNLETEEGQASPLQFQPASKWSLTNVYCDVVISQTMTNSTGHGAFAVYTNGVFMDREAMNTVAISLGDYFGSSWGNNSASTAFSVLFQNLSRSSSTYAYLQEHWIWTNAAPGAANGNDINATDLAHFHKYGTNTYKYSP